MSKTVFLVRHAKAIGREKPIPDFERSLTPKGLLRSREMAEYTLKRGFSPDLMISSPASRACETALAFAGVFGYPEDKIIRENIIYDAIDGREIIGAVTDKSDQYHSLFLFGHNPTISEAAGILSPGFDQSIAKAGLVAVKFSHATWPEIETDGGELLFYWEPKKVLR